MVHVLACSDAFSLAFSTTKSTCSAACPIRSHRSPISDATLVTPLVTVFFHQNSTDKYEATLAKHSFRPKMSLAPTKPDTGHQYVPRSPQGTKIGVEPTPWVIGGTFGVDLCPRRATRSQPVRYPGHERSATSCVVETRYGAMSNND